MSAIILSCPHCGYTKEFVFNQEIDVSKKVVCPGCSSRFSLEKAFDERNAIVNDKASLSYNHWRETTHSNVDRNKIHQEVVDYTCIDNIMREGWVIYRSKVGNLSIICLFACLISLAPWTALGAIQAYSQLLLVNVSAIFVLAVLSFSCFIFGICAMLHEIMGHNSSVFESVSAGLEKLPGIMFISICLAVVVLGGGLLFLIPALILSVLFSLSFYVYIYECEGCINSLRVSCQYVVSNFSRNLKNISIIFLLILISCATIFTSVVIIPYMLACLYLIYNDMFKKNKRVNKVYSGYSSPVVYFSLIFSVALLFVFGNFVIKKAKTSQFMFSAQIEEVAEQFESAFSYIKESVGIHVQSKDKHILTMDKKYINPEGKLVIYFLPWNFNLEDCYISIVDDSGCVQENHVLSKSIQREGAFNLKAPKNPGYYFVNVYHDTDRTNLIYSKSFRVVDSLGQ